MTKSGLLLLLTFFVFSPASLAQAIRSYMTPMGGLADTKKGAFSSMEAGFSIDLPKRTGGFSGVTGIRYSWRLNEGFFVAGIIDRDRKIEGSDEFQKETLKIIDQTVNDFARDYFATRANAVKVDRKDARFAGHQGLETRVLLPDSVCIVRVFWIENRAYITGVLLAGTQQRFEEVALKVFDSLKPISAESKDAMFKKLIEENTPTDLPQTPFVKQQKSDAEDDGLRGKVKTVFQESQWLRGKRAGTPKEKDSEEYFDSNGYRLKRISYSDTNGFPDEITVYGFIAGKRVSRSQHITFESSPGGILINEPPSATRRRDNRYDMQYLAKYDANGTRVEYILYDNAGRIWTRTVCTPASKTKSCVMYDERGKVNQRWSETVDDRGNEVESVHQNSPMEGWTAKYVYKYEEFDETGNWTKRTMSLFRIFAGIEKEEWVMREYRTLSYYP